MSGHKSGWRPAPGDRYQHVAHLEHSYAHPYLRHIGRYGQRGVTEVVDWLLTEHGPGSGPAEASPATPWAEREYWDRVGDHLIFWHSGHFYVCLERVIPAGSGVTA